MRAMEDVRARGSEQFFGGSGSTARPSPISELNVEHEQGALSVTVKQVRRSTRTHPRSYFLHVRRRPPEGQTGAPTRAASRKRPTRHRALRGAAQLRRRRSISPSSPTELARSDGHASPAARRRAHRAAGAGSPPPRRSAKRPDSPRSKRFEPLAREQNRVLGRARRTSPALSAETRLGSPSMFESSRQDQAPEGRRAVVQALGQFALRGIDRRLSARRSRTRATSSNPRRHDSLGQPDKRSTFETLVEILIDRWGGRHPGRRARRARIDCADDRANSHVLRAHAIRRRARVDRRAAVMALAKLTSERKHREALEEPARRHGPPPAGRGRACAGRDGDAKGRAALSRRLDRETRPRSTPHSRSPARFAVARGSERSSSATEFEKLRPDQAELP